MTEAKKIVELIDYHRGIDFIIDRLGQKRKSVFSKLEELSNNFLHLEKIQLKFEIDGQKVRIAPSSPKTFLVQYPVYITWTKFDILIDASPDSFSDDLKEEAIKLIVILVVVNFAEPEDASKVFQTICNNLRAQGRLSDTAWSPDLSLQPDDEYRDMTQSILRFLGRAIETTPVMLEGDVLGEPEQGRTEKAYSGTTPSLPSVGTRTNKSLVKIAQGAEEIDKTEKAYSGTTPTALSAGTESLKSYGRVIKSSLGNKGSFAQETDPESPEMYCRYPEKVEWNPTSKFLATYSPVPEQVLRIFDLNEGLRLAHSQKVQVMRNMEWNTRLNVLGFLSMNVLRFWPEVESLSFFKTYPRVEVFRWESEGKVLMTSESFYDSFVKVYDPTSGEILFQVKSEVMIPRTVGWLEEGRSIFLIGGSVYFSDGCLAFYKLPIQGEGEEWLLEKSASGLIYSSFELKMDSARKHVALFDAQDNSVRVWAPESKETFQICLKDQEFKNLEYLWHPKKSELFTVSFDYQRRDEEAEDKVVLRRWDAGTRESKELVVSLPFVSLASFCFSTGFEHFVVLDSGGLVQVFLLSDHGEVQQHRLKDSISGCKVESFWASKEQLSILVFVPDEGDKAHFYLKHIAGNLTETSGDDSEEEDDSSEN